MEWFDTTIGNVELLVLAALLVVAAILVIMTYVKTRSLVPTLMSLVVAGLVVYAVNHLELLSGLIGSELPDNNSAPQQPAPSEPAQNI